MLWLAPAWCCLCRFSISPVVLASCMLTLPCAVSGWGLDNDVVPGLFCLLDYVGVFPTREIGAPQSSPLKENGQDSGVDFRHRQANSMILASGPNHLQFARVQIFDPVWQSQEWDVVEKTLGFEPPTEQETSSSI